MKEKFSLTGKKTGLGDKLLRKLREEGRIDFLPRGIKGRGYRYDEENVAKYLDSQARKAKPPELPFEILKKEVKRDFQCLKGGANMSKKWEKVIAKKGPLKGQPTGCLRHRGYGFSLIKDPKKKLGSQYSLDIRHPKRTTKGLRKIAGRPIADDSDALNVAYKSVTDRFHQLEAASSPDITFSQFIPIYAEDLKRRKRRKAEDMVKRVKAVLEPHFGRMKLREIKFTDVEHYRNKRQDTGVKDSSIANEIALARALFNVAVIKDKVNVRNPFERVGIHLGLHIEERERWMQPEEKKRLWAVLRKIPPMLELAVVLLNTGMRPHNLISLLWKQIHWSERLIYIPKDQFKTNKEAYFPFNDTVMKILKHQKEQNPHGPNDFVFVRKDGRGRLIPINRNWYQKEWRRACAEADIEGLRFYDLKHTLGTMLAAAGVDQFIIKDTFNHTQLSSTERYVKSYKTSVAEALKKVEHILNGVSL